MRNIILTLIVLILFGLNNIYSDDLINEIDKSGQKYSQQDIENNLYIIHSYKQNSLDKTKFEKIIDGDTTAFYIGKNKLVTSLNIFGKNKEIGFYIVCKNSIVDNELKEKCINTAKLVYYNNYSGFAILEVEGLSGIDLNDTYFFNPFSGVSQIYGSVFSYENNLDVVGNIFKRDFEDIEWEYDRYNMVTSGDIGFVSIDGGPVFYNDNFLGIVSNTKVVTKWYIYIISNLLDKGDYIFGKYKTNQKNYLEFKDYFNTVKKNLELRSRALVSFGLKKEGLYENIYEIYSYDKIKSDKKIDGIYMVYYTYQMEFDSTVPQVIDNIYGFPSSFKTLNNEENKKIVEIKSKDININVKDYFKDFQGKNSYVEFVIYLKIGDTYYMENTNTYNYNSFELGVKQKLEKALRLTNKLNSTELNLLSDSMDEKINKLKKVYGEEKYKDFKNNLVNKLEKLKKQKKLKLIDIIFSIKSEDDFEKNKINIGIYSLYLSKIDILLNKISEKSDN